MVDLGILAVIIWVGCFLVVSVDSTYRKISPVFWRLAALFGGPFALLAYGIIRERRSEK
jgi:drug/metabolite transporter (DMT)-like permease